MELATWRGKEKDLSNTKTQIKHVILSSSFNFI